MVCHVMNVGDDACSGTPVEYTATSGTIRSPEYATYTYPDNSDCQWRITASSVYVRIFPKLEKWANAQLDGRPAEHRWRPLFNSAKFG